MITNGHNTRINAQLTCFGNVNECKWQWFLCLKLYYCLHSYFLSSFYIQNSLPLINTNTKYYKQIVIFPLKGATFSISVPRQHPAPLVNGIFLPTIALLPLWSGGGESAQSISQNNSNHSIPHSANAIWRDMHQHFKVFYHVIHVLRY
jgi:hypothetical protein